MVISYSHLFDLVRKERASQELQELSDGFYEETRDLLAGLTRAAADERLDGGDIAHMQLANSRKLLKELYDRREQKILLLAQNRARTNSLLVDTPNLLPRERMLFDRVVAVLSDARIGVTTTTITETRTVIETVQVTKTVESAPAALDAEPSVIITHEEPVTEVVHHEHESHESVALEEPMMLVRMIRTVPAFMGKDMTTYGPFEENSYVEIPASVANVLIRKGSAQRDTEDETLQ